jgi:hypothetical protein
MNFRIWWLEICFNFYIQIIIYIYGYLTNLNYSDFDAVFSAYPSNEDRDNMKNVSQVWSFILEQMSETN